MGIFDFLKKTVGTADRTAVQKSQKKVNITFTETINGKTSTLKPSNDVMLSSDLEHLTKDGELPWGWYTHTKEFTNKINNEYSYFLNIYIDSRTKSPKEQYQALKSFVLYLEDVEKLCKSKGECYEFWFYKILTAEDYLEKRKKELDELVANLDELQANYDIRKKELLTLDERIVKELKEHPDILQSEFVKLFDPAVKGDVTEKLYWMDKSKKLERIKSGRSYILRYKE